MMNQHLRSLVFSVVAVAATLCSGTAWALDSAGSGYWDDDATWAGDVPAESDDVVIKDGHTVTIRDNTTININSLTIEDGGTLTHLANSTTGAGEQYKIVLNIEDSLNIESTGKIDVEGKGFNATQGHGVGSHGGRGATHGGNVSGPTYGLYMSPTNLGSGGVSGNSSGGGAVIIEVTGSSVLSGTINANASLGGQGWGAAGGSVYLRTGTISGNGAITANGSDGAGGNGGGRIAIILTGNEADFSDFEDATVSAYGGDHSSRGAAGTVYMESKAQEGGFGVLTIDNINRSTAAGITTAIPAGQDWTGPSIELLRRGILGIPDDVTVDFTNSVITFDTNNFNSGITLLGGTFIVPDDFAYTNFTLRYFSDSTFNPSSITVGDKAHYITHVGYTLPGNFTVQSGGSYTAGSGMFTVNGNVLVAGGGSMTHLANAGTELYKLNLTVGSNFTLQATGNINVNAKGRNSPAWGSHGGLSGHHNSHPVPFPTYGSITAPTNVGLASRQQGARGGGAAILDVKGASDISGTISADGGNASGWSAPGGSVYIRAETIAGNGTITANGNNGAAAGGGGRISLVLEGDGADFSNFADATIRAFGGVDGSNRGGCGTIYMETEDDGAGRGLLLIKGDGNAPSPLANTLISDDVTDTTVGSVLITNAAVLAVSNQVLTVHGNWDNKATTLGLSDSTVEFAGTDTATIRGHNTFYDLVSTNALKTLHFEDGKTNTVNGTLTLANVTLNSISESGAWYLKASPPPHTHSVSNVTVANSDARPGYQITAIDSINDDNNFNWVFVAAGPQVNTWTGTEDSDWANDANWSLVRPTVETDDVIIPADCPHYPELNGDKRIQSLSISNGASLNLAEYDLTVDEDVRVAGTLTAMGSETLTLRGNLDFSGGGSFTAASSLLELDGTNTQNIVSAGNAFNKLTVNHRASPVVFADSVSVVSFVNHGVTLTFDGELAASSSFNSQDAEITFGGPVTADVFSSANGALVFEDTVNMGAFTNWAGNATFHDVLNATTFYAAPGDMELTFASGKRYTIANLALYGRAGARMLLRGSAASPWELNVTGSSDVRLVDVEYSDASYGETIRPLASVDGDNNTNWDFGGPWLTWASTSSTDFLDENNWDPVGTPDSDKHLLIDGYNTVTPILSGVATVAQLVVGGGLEAVTLTVNGHLTTVGNATILDGGTLNHAGNDSAEINKLHLTAGSNFTLVATANINVNARGRNSPAWGSHGGLSGHHGTYPVPLPTYGSITAPTNVGLASRQGGARGGGAAILDVKGSSDISGTISANGGANQGWSAPGGSVYIRTETITGNGAITANGNNAAAPGGGGRISLVLEGDGADFSNFEDATLRAFGGVSAANRGACGTIYMETKDDGEGRGLLLISGDGTAPSPLASTLISADVTDTAVGSVIITNAARLSITNNLLTVHGDWLKSANATFTAHADSTVDFTGPAPATVQGDNTFYNLTAGAMNKTIQFEAGKTNIVNGKLTFRDRTTLLSTDNGMWTYLVLSPEGTQEVGSVIVRDNHAGLYGGQEIIAAKGSLDLGNNVNWDLPPRGTIFMIR